MNLILSSQRKEWQLKSIPFVTKLTTKKLPKKGSDRHGCDSVMTEKIQKVSIKFVRFDSIQYVADNRKGPRILGRISSQKNNGIFTQ